MRPREYGHPRWYRVPPSRHTSRLVAQIERVMDIDQLSTVTAEVVETARESLVVGVL
ncbi:hypothetical protein [Actinacidiphila oryziradicis]|uniref:hypothetical protein n=1 Tax=Actinacidiphila oryziradicis TaxID=2571141 RepID=UPI001B8025B7